MLFPLCLCLVLAANALADPLRVGQKPSPEKLARMRARMNPNLFEGDIKGIDPTDRNAIPSKHYRWTNGVIPYQISSKLKHIEDMILEAMDWYEQRTCIRFVERTDEKNYVKFVLEEGCNSYVGMIGGKQTVNLDKECHVPGIIAHEIGHAIGFYHEHNRSDRDDYVTIHFENMAKADYGEFKKLSPHQNTLYNKFDYGSIMIYGNYQASSNGEMTIVATDGRLITDSEEMEDISDSDEYRVKKMYHCE